MVYIAAKSLAFSIRSGAKQLVLTQTDTQNCVSYSLLKKSIPVSLQIVNTYRR